jgi:SSS family transporter
MFGITDYIVFFLTIFISLCIGIFFAVSERKRNTTVDYFLAGRKSSTLPAALSFAVSFLSSLVVIGFPAESYAYGVGLAYYAIGISVAYIFAAVFIVPVMFPLKLISVYEYFNLRYGNNVLRYIALGSGIIYTLFYMASVTVGTSVALQVVLGIPSWGTILIYTLVTAIYTSIGGIKAVIWTDVFQLIIMAAGMVAILIKSSVDVGGPENVYRYAKDRFDATDFNVDPTIRYQFWNVSFGIITQSLYVTLAQQSMQRIYSLPTVNKARAIFVIATPFYAMIVVMGVLEGIVLFAYFSEKGCDILEAGIIDNVNAIVPFAVLELFHNQPGLAGLFTACLSSAGLSTLSSCLSSLSAITYEDIIKVHFRQITPCQATRIAKIFVLFYGVVAIALSFFMLHIPGSISAIFIGFISCMDGPVCALFIVSLMCRRITTTGISIGLVCGCGLVCWLIIGSNFSDVPPYPYLAHGPIDECSLYLNSTDVRTEDTLKFYNASTTSMSLTGIPFSMTFTSSPAPNATVSSSSLLHTIYSISYTLYSLIGFCTTICVGLAVSFCTKRQDTIDERCLFSFRKHMLNDLFVCKQSKCEHYKKNEDVLEDVRFLSKETEF